MEWCGMVCDVWYVREFSVCGVRRRYKAWEGTLGNKGKMHRKEERKVRRESLKACDIKIFFAGMSTPVPVSLLFL